MHAPGSLATTDLSNEAEARPRTPLRVLVLQKESRDRDRLVRIISDISPDAKVLALSLGAQAEHALKLYEFDLAFVDCDITDLPGPTILAWATSREKKHVLVLLTDRLSSDWAAVADRVGAYEVMLKPVNDSHVERLIEAHEMLQMELRILIADKHRSHRRVMTDVFERVHFPCTIDQTDSCISAIRICQANPIDIVLVGAELAEADGLEAACRILAAAPDVHVIFTSASSRWTSDLARCHFGLAGYLKQPFHPAQAEFLLHSIYGVWRPYLLNARVGKSQVWSRFESAEQER
jgi:DNA-binding NtrC family response regulator